MGIIAHLIGHLISTPKVLSSRICQSSWGIALHCDQHCAANHLSPPRTTLRHRELETHQIESQLEVCLRFPVENRNSLAWVLPTLSVCPTYTGRRANRSGLPSTLFDWSTKRTFKQFRLGPRYARLVVALAQKPTKT